MNKNLYISFFCAFMYFLCFQFSVFSSVNYVENLVIKSTPKTPKNKRLRLTNGLSDEAWKGENGKNILKIDLGSNRIFNTIRLKLKNDATFETIKIKTGTTLNNKELVYETSNVSGLANEWITLDGFRANGRYINLVVKKQRPKIFELEIYYKGQDVNGDGFDDFIVGAHTYTLDGISILGRAYLYLGGETISSIPALTLIGDESSANYGFSVSMIGDVNGDGFDDFIVCAFAHDAEAGSNQNRGRAYVYFGGNPVDSTADFIINGDEENGRFGIASSGIGDANGDGFDDFIVGADFHDLGLGGNPNRGRAYVYFGGSVLNVTPDLVIDGDKDDGAMGAKVAGLGDINRDGFDDFMVTAPSHDANGINQGRAYVYLGGSVLDADHADDADLTITGDVDQVRMGSSCDGIGDINGDGYSDFIVGAYLHGALGASNSARGRAYIYLGSSVLVNTSAAILNGEEDVGFFGNASAGLGDVNGDGFDDFIVGAELQDNVPSSGDNKGQAHIYLPMGLSIGNPTTLFGDFNNVGFGAGVAGIGDINNDGYMDIIVGAPYYNSKGYFKVYLGSQNGFDLNPVLNVNANESQQANLGISVD